MTSTASSSPSPDRGAPIGSGAPDEAASTLPAEPSHTTPVKHKEQQDSPMPSQVERHAGDEEPELTLEPDVPSDGRDEKGEAMIRELRRPEEPQRDKDPSPKAGNP